MNKHTDSENKKRLSIQLSLDGFSFCVQNIEDKQYQNFVTIDFSSKANTPAILLQEVKKVFEKEEVLHNTFDEVLLIHHNELHSMVPNAYFDERILNRYLKYNVKTFEHDFVSFDTLTKTNIHNVYIPFVNINNFIFDSFGSFTYLHSATVFLENILKNNFVSDKEMFVNVHTTNFQLLVIENNQLVLSNYFNFRTKEDFVYYILFVAEQLKMNTNEFSLTLFGTIKEQDSNYKLLYNYVRNIFVYNKLNSNLGADITTLPQEHYNLLQLHI